MKFKVFGILFFIVTTIFSQQANISLEKSKVYKDEKKRTYLNFTLSDNQGGYFFFRPFYVSKMQSKYKIKGYYIDHFNKNNELIASIPYGDKMTNIYGAYIKENKLFVIDGSVDVIRIRNKTVSFRLLESPLDTFKFVEKKEIKINLNDKYGHVMDFFEDDEDDLNHDFLKFKVSENKEYFALNYNLIVKGKEHHFIGVYDRELNKVYENEIVLNPKKENFNFDSLAIDERDQSVYLVGRLNKKIGLKGDIGKPINYKVYKLTKDDNISLNMNMKDSYITPLYPAFVNEELYLTSMYYHKKSKKGGVALFVIDRNTFELKNKKTPTIFKEMFSKNTRWVLNSPIFSFKKMNYEVKTFDKLANDEFVLTAEEFYETGGKASYSSVPTGFNVGGATMMMGGNTNAPPMVSYNNMLVIIMDKDGNLKKVAKIEKKHIAPKGLAGHASFVHVVKGNKIYYLMNATRTVTQDKKEKVTFRGSIFKNKGLMLVSCDLEGELEYQKITVNEDVKMGFLVKDAILGDEGEIIVFGRNKKKQKQMIRLQIND